MQALSAPNHKWQIAIHLKSLRTTPIAVSDNSDRTFKSHDYDVNLFRNGQSTVGGPLQAKMDQNGPFWSILVSRMLKSISE